MSNTADIESETTNTQVTTKKSTKGTGRPKKDWTIVSALETVLTTIHSCELKKTILSRLKSPLAYLNETLGLSGMQPAFIAMLVDSGVPLSFRNFSVYLGCSRLKVLAYGEELDDLVAKRWLTKGNKRGESEAFSLELGVVKALSNNKPFVPEKIDGLTEKQFYTKAISHLERCSGGCDGDIEAELEWIDRMIEANPELPVCQMMQHIDGDCFDRGAFLLVIKDYIEWNNTPDEGLTKDGLSEYLNDNPSGSITVNMMEDGQHSLFRLGLVEFKCDDGVADTERYMLTSDVKAKLFPVGNNIVSKRKRRNNRGANELKKSKDIKAKHLFFNENEQRQVDRLASLLSKEKLVEVQNRLTEQGMRKGVACLFYGGPGTGKTETVLQLARQTGRDIMQVNIAGMKDKWVGESEKNIKAVFTRYRELCQECALTPILFFNEADALINRRSGNADSSADKMNNAMQNILLQELEDLDGILIATTNLTEALDDAFERRFLFKVEFHKPNAEVKAKIWTSMINDLTADEAKTLASRYDFSGGQIENIARKKTIDYIISGEPATLESLEKYCQDEQLASKTKRQRIAGFGA